MLYPVLWLVMSSFKESESDLSQRRIPLIPQSVGLWRIMPKAGKGSAGHSFGVFINNSLRDRRACHDRRCILVCAGRVRLRPAKFAGNAFWFGVMMVTLMLPHDVVLVPQYILFSESRLAQFVSSRSSSRNYFGAPFFIFLMIQFIRTIPAELDEAATIDGCGKFRLFYRIILPLIVPAMATAAIFSFYWRWEDLIGPVLYLNSASQYPVSMGLKMFLDSETVSNWGAMFAMSVAQPGSRVMLYSSHFQKHIVEGISTSGLK